MTSIVRIHDKASLLLSGLLSIILTSIMALVLLEFFNTYQQVIEKHYHNYQALQIIENQFNLKIAGIDCQSQIRQNQIIFYIKCDQNSITVKSNLINKKIDILK